MLSPVITTLTVLAGHTLAAPSPLSARVGQAAAQAFTTTSDLKNKLSAVDPPLPGIGNPGGASTWSLSIDDTEAGYKQKISGFGGSVTDATVTVLNALSSDLRSQLLKELLTSDGANLSLLRHTIAASDLSGPPAYTYDDNSNSADPSLSSFYLGDRGTAMANLLKEIKEIRSDVTIFGSPWSAPGWMKLNRALTGNANNNSLDSQYYSQYAQYFIKYLQAYAGLGVTVDAITIQNEPLNSQGNGHITMLQKADEAARVTRDYIGPALRGAGLNTQIWAYDHNTDTPSYPQTVIDVASEYVQATAWHCYASNLDWTVLTDFHNANPRKSQYMTECWTSPRTSWYQSSKNTVGPLQNWAEGSLMWTLGTWTEASDGTFGPYIPGGCSTCRGLFVVDEAAKSYEYTVDYYILAQFSKYIPTGATILSGSGSYSYDGYSGIQSVASMNPDGTRTVVVENTFASDVYLTLNTTSGEQWSGSLLGNSVTTWILP
ncbi:glycoside hydrolase family 30 protein [Annulohypoxylon maeteangense]|uniref:glycoside hydrolase family 30 protein n=1 Tax=Annulohypoxylon maeteangense TaxID=1927788 RepID=UPI002008D66C|nr:glycoside hydrolase family 30 protein [Annulohypoxylon maeteangense]KAI0888524.1 glycoside hydrolase family 30 protein [Annulohypoxylon maeteangense]